MAEPSWRKYEKVAIELLNKFAEEFGLKVVQRDQKVTGLHSNTEWNIEGKGIFDGENTFIIVECRKYNKKLTQESVGALAYRILDSGSSGGILVTPIGIQDGAKKVAEANNILSVFLSADSSSTDYVMNWLNEIKVGMSGSITPTGELKIEVTRGDGSNKH